MPTRVLATGPKPCGGKDKYEIFIILFDIFIHSFKIFFSLFYYVVCVPKLSPAMWL